MVGSRPSVVVESSDYKVHRVLDHLVAGIHHVLGRNWIDCSYLVPVAMIVVNAQLAGFLEQECSASQMLVECADLYRHQNFQTRHHCRLFLPSLMEVVHRWQKVLE